MTLLSIVQEFCERTGVPTPTAVISSIDVRVRQVRRLLEEICRDAASRGRWEKMVFESVWTTVADEDQGLMTTLAPQGFRYIINDTAWSRTQAIPLYGPLGSVEWQALKTLVRAGPQYQFRIRQGHFIANPTPPAGHIWAFEYYSSLWEEIDGIGHASFTNDESTIRIPDEVVLLGLRWKYKMEKGLDYTEDFNTYERTLADSLARDGGATVLHMDEEPGRAQGPGIYVPWGNWLQP